MLDNLPKPLLIALGIGAVILVVIIILNRGSSPQMVTPSNGGGGGSGGGSGMSSTDVTSINSAIQALQQQIAAMPAGTSQDQLTASLNGLLASIQSGNADNQAAIQQSIASMQQSIEQSGAANANALTAALSDFTNAITSSNSQLQNYMQSQISVLEKYLPSLNITTNDPHSLYEALMTNGYWNAVSAGDNNAAMQAFYQGMKEAYPGLQNVSYATIGDWYNNSGIKTLLANGGSDTTNRNNTNVALTQFFTQLVNQGYAQGVS